MGEQPVNFLRSLFKFGSSEMLFPSRLAFVTHLLLGILFFPFSNGPLSFVTAVRLFCPWKIEYSLAVVAVLSGPARLFYVLSAPRRTLAKYGDIARRPRSSKEDAFFRSYYFVVKRSHTLSRLLAVPDHRRCLHLL